MSNALRPAGPRPGVERRPGAAGSRYVLLLVVSALVLVACCLLGLVAGSNPLPVGSVLRALTQHDPTDPADVIVWQSRLPRTVLSILVGAALGLSGALMQAVTRNPLAEPGLFAVNAGAAAAVVAAITLLGITGLWGYIWFAFAGAGIAAVAVYLIGSSHRSQATPARLALAGAAMTMVLAAVTDTMVLNNEIVFSQFRFWVVGSTQGRTLTTAAVIAPFVVTGIVLALLLIRPLNALGLGDDTARSLGARPGVVRAVAAFTAVLLAGAATAAVGPISFVGLAAPHLVRMVVGGDQRRLIPAVLLIAPSFLLVADLLGRWIIAPAEIQTGVMTAVLGGPVFVALVRSRRVAGL